MSDRPGCRRRAAPPSRAPLRRSAHGSLNAGFDESSPTCAAIDRGVGLGLPRRGETELLEQDRRDDQADRPDEVEPFEIGIALDFRRHARHPDDGQR